MDVRNLVAVLGFAVLVALFFVYAARGGEKLVAAKKARLEAARPARAKVLATRQGRGALVQNGRRGPEIVLTLEVEGRVVEVCWYVFELGLPKIQEGATVPVRVDAGDPTVVFPDADWAELETTTWIRLLKV